MSGLVVDLFAGGGGASAGIEAALGRPVDVAVNHCAAAVAMHAANHPAPRELFAAQGFAPSHILDGLGLTKTALIRLAGNSVCPPVAEALVRANCGAARRAEVA